MTGHRCRGSNDLVHSSKSHTWCVTAQVQLMAQAYLMQGFLAEGTCRNRNDGGVVFPEIHRPSTTNKGGTRGPC